MCVLLRTWFQWTGALYSCIIRKETINAATRGVLVYYVWLVGNTISSSLCVVGNTRSISLLGVADNTCISLLGVVVSTSTISSMCVVGNTSRICLLGVWLVLGTMCVVLGTMCVVLGTSTKCVQYVCGHGFKYQVCTMCVVTAS